MMDLIWQLGTRKQAGLGVKPVPPGGEKQHHWPLRAASVGGCKRCQDGEMAGIVTMRLECCAKAGL